MKTWLITGCSSGIGRGIALAALKQGDQVVLAARNLEKLRVRLPQRGGGRREGRDCPPL